MNEYSQGVCEDGAAILKNGQMMTIDEIVETLCRLESQRDELLKAAADYAKPDNMNWQRAMGLFINLRNVVAKIEAEKNK